MASLVPLLSVLGLCLAASCDPGTTRPDVLPLPRSQQVEVVLDRAEAITHLRDVLVADSFPIARFDARDAWLEGPWVDHLTRRPVSPHRLGPDVVRLRAWAEPARPGNSTLIVELAWRVTADPSVPPRDLERPVAPDDSIAVWLKGVLAVVDSAVGFHQANGAGH